ncbi:MAG: hypothetical protein ACSLFI_05260 [Solirubrobacterales bacterium]
MNLGGTLVNTVVRLVILFATLALVYLFIIKPVLSTTENVSKGINGNISNVMDDVNEAFEESNQAGGYDEVQIKRRITTVNGKDQQRLLKCVQNANQNINRIQRCAAKFSP